MDWSLSSFTRWLSEAFQTFVTSPISRVLTVAGNIGGYLWNTLSPFYTWITQAINSLLRSTVGLFSTLFSVALAAFAWFKSLIASFLPQFGSGSADTTGFAPAALLDYFCDFNVLVQFSVEALSWFVAYYAIFVSGFSVWVLSRVARVARGS